MLYNDDILYNLEEKLHFVIKSLNLKNGDIASRLEISSGLVSQIQNHYNGKLRKCHLYAICYAYNIPIEIFENHNINTKEIISSLLTQREKIFHKNYDLLEKLKGKWYLYSYPSNLNLSDVWITETTIYEDFSVEDMHQNRGRLYIGKNQSIILKESNNAKNLTSITFDNNRVTYDNFAFSRVSKSNSVDRELFNFGFFSRNKMNKDEAKEVLGETKKVQLHMDSEMLDRISCCIDMVG